MSEQEKGNPFVGIAAVIGGISIPIVAIIALFAKDQLMVAPWVIGVLAVMGVILGFMALKKQDKE